MAFDNITDLPGYETPIDLRTLRGPILGGFSQRMSVPGNLTNYNFLPTPQSSNGISTGSTFGNSFPLMPPFNLGMPLATVFNFDIDGGGGGGGDIVSITGDGTYIGVTGSHPNFALTFDETQICDYVESYCPGSFSDPYYKFMADQQATTTAAAIQGDTFRIIGDWIDGSGGGNDIGFIETELNGSGYLQILYKRLTWESFYDGSASYAFPTSTFDTFQFLGDGTYITSAVSSGGSCTYSLDIEAVRTETDQNLFSTIDADLGTAFSAATTTDTLTFAYDTDGGDYDNSIVITADNTSNTVKFKLDMEVVNRSTPATCLVYVGGAVAGVSSPPGFSLSDTGKKYSATAKVSDFDASTNEVTVTNVTIDLWDMGYNEGQAWVSDASDLYEDVPAPANVTETISLTGNWVLATRIHPAFGENNPAYVTSYFPRLKTQCETP